MQGKDCAVVWGEFMVIKFAIGVGGVGDPGSGPG